MRLPRPFFEQPGPVRIYRGGAVIILILFAAAIALGVLMTGAWVAQRRTGQSGWIDTIWSFAVGAVGAGLALAPIQASGWPTGRQILVATLALAWSLRLGLHIMRRTRKGGDDPRYKALADEWREDFSRRLFWFLQIQAASGFVLTISIFVAAHNPHAFPAGGDIFGTALLVVAIIGEAIADNQLARFAAKPENRNRVCEEGLWGASRHPNYFFEWLGWVAYPIIAVGLPPANATGLIALIGPIFVYWLLVHISGIPPLEAHMARSRGDAFRTYRQRVNAFFPGPARKEMLADRRPRS
jgi:steroid 5-alpha reductase family enzyme